MRKIIVFSICNIIMFSSALAHFPDPRTCFVYYKDKLHHYRMKDVDFIKQLKSQEDGSALQVCFINWFEKQRYYAVFTKIFKYKNLCIFNSSPIYKRKGNNKWSYTPSKEKYGHSTAITYMAFNRDGECLPHSVKDYLPVENISSGVFYSISRGIRNVFSSEKEFSQAFKIFEKRGNGQSNSTQKQMISSLKKIVSNNSNPKFELIGMSLRKLRNVPPYIEVRIKDKFGGYWLLDLLLDGNKIVFLQISQAIQ